MATPWIRRGTSAPAGTASTSTDPAAHATTLRLLREGEIEVMGRLPGSSNQALVVQVRHPGHDAPVAAVYKATLGERPLFDFPDGTLTHREVAAYLVSEALGWDIVPPTVRRDGPFGPGMLQAWVEVDERVDRVALVVDADPRLRRMAIFDAIVNNTDRKAGHVLPLADGRIQGVDHGVTFSVQPKLRTVLWAWMGQPFTPDEAAALARIRSDLRGRLGTELLELLDGSEVTATRRRVGTLIRTGRFPRPNPTWPAVPWPAY